MLFFFSFVSFNLDVCVSNPLSTHSCTLQLSVLQPSSHSPLISVFFASLRVPRRIHFLRADNADNVIMEVACLHHAVTPHMHKVGGQTVVFSLSFPSEEDGTDSRDVKNVFLQIPDGWNGTLVSWSDKAELMYMYTYMICVLLSETMN